jgi:hypothetical protein
MHLRGSCIHEKEINRQKAGNIRMTAIIRELERIDT